MTSERRLMIDLLAASEAYSRLEISDIGLVRTHHNPADALTKVGRCNALERIIELGVVDHPVEQWVIRPAPQHHPTSELDRNARLGNNATFATGKGASVNQEDGK